MLSDRANKFYNKKVTIYRLSTTQDKFGGTENEWVKMDWVVPCRIYGYTGMMMIDILGVTYPVERQMMVSSEYSIELGDKIEDETQKYIVLRIIPRTEMEKTNRNTVLLGRQDA